MDTIISKVKDLTPAEKAQCASLSYRKNGDLYFWLKRYPEGTVVRIVDDGKLLGWGMKVLKSGGKYATGYYVRKTERRKGLGAKIFYTLNKTKTKTIVYPHNQSSAAFFYSLGMAEEWKVKMYGVDTKGVRKKPRKSVMA